MEDDLRGPGRRRSLCTDFRKSFVGENTTITGYSLTEEEDLPKSAGRKTV